MVRYLLAFPLWGDESFVAVNFIKRDYMGMIQPLVYGQIVPLLFMWAELAVVREWGLGELALRAVPFAAGIVSLLLFWRLAARVLRPSAAMLAVGIFAASVYPIRHAAEVKPYATDLLVSLILTMLTLHVLSRPRSIVAWSALAIGLAISVWASYPAVFVGATIITLLGYRVLTGHDWSRPISLPNISRPPIESTSSTRASSGAARLALIATFATALVFVVSWAVMYVTFAKPHADAAARLTQIPMWTETFPPITKPWKLPIWAVSIHTGNMFAYPIGAKAPGSIYTFLLVVVASVTLWRSRRRELLWLLLGPLVFTFFAAAMKKYPYGGSVRTSIYMAPAFCLLAGYGIHVLFTRVAPFRFRWLPSMPRWVRALDWRATPATIACSFLFMAICVGGIFVDVKTPARSPEVAKSQKLVRDLVARTSPNDRWIVFNATEPVDYAPYLGDWIGIGAQWVFDVMRFAPVKCDWAPRPQDVEKPPGKLFLLVYEYSGKKGDFPDEKLAAYVQAFTARFGAPTMQRDVIKEKNKPNEPPQVEAQHVYVFGGD